MGIVLNVQLSVFSNCRIEPNTQNISNLMNKINCLGIKDFLPNVTAGQTIDLVKGTVNATPNLTFVTADKSAQIVCLDERIDCVFNYTQEQECDLEEALQWSEDIVSLIVEEFNIMSYRLALNISLLSNPYNDDIRNTDFGSKLVSVLNFYDDKTLKEWSTRQNAWCPITISNQEEMLNVITELSMVTNETGDEKRILCHMDINTIPENVSYRFNSEMLREFVCQTKVIASEIRTKFEELSVNA